MEYWIDDERDPTKFLEKKKTDKVTWIKEIHEAMDQVENNAENIEILYLDHYMDSDYVFGSEVLLLVICLGKEKFKNLKKIYIHTSDKTISKKLIEKYQSKLKGMNIELIKANYT